MKPPYKSMWPSTLHTIATIPWRILVAICLLIFHPWHKPHKQSEATMLQNRPEPGRDQRFSIGGLNFCFGLEVNERIIAISVQLDPINWEWVCKQSIPDKEVAKITMKEWAQFLVTDLPKLQATFQKYLASVLPDTDPEIIPDYVGAEALHWLILNRVTIDGKGGFKVNTTGIL